MRTTRETLTFESPFSLTAVDEVMPAGAYTVEMDEELIEGLSFLAYRRVATTIYLPLRRGGTGSFQAIRVDPAELDAALEEPSLRLACNSGGRRLLLPATSAAPPCSRSARQNRNEDVPCTATLSVSLFAPKAGSWDGPARNSIWWSGCSPLRIMTCRPIASGAFRTASNGLPRRTRSSLLEPIGI